MNRIIAAALNGRRALIVDWDNTLADTHERNYRALTDALAPYGTTVTRDWYRQHSGLSLLDLLAQVPSPTPLPSDRILASSRARLLALTTPDTLTAIPATADLVRQAHAANLPCAIASGAGAILVHTGLEVLGLTDHFAVVVTRDDVEHGKPAPDTFLEAAHRLDINPNDCLAVDDAPDGILAAQRAGMQVLLIQNGQLTWPPTNVAGR